MFTSVSAGIATHALPKDLRTALVKDHAGRDLWNGLTPLGRNEFICWVISATLMKPAPDGLNAPSANFMKVNAAPAAGPAAATANALVNHKKSRR